MTARDFPCVVQIEPTDSGIQSICAFMILVMAVALRAAPDLALRPCRKFPAFLDLRMAHGCIIRKR